MSYSKEEILRRNECIARLIGVDVDYSETEYRDSRSFLRHKINHLSKSEGLLFHSDWSWIMETVNYVRSFIDVVGIEIIFSLGIIVKIRFNGEWYFYESVDPIEPIWLAISDYAEFTLNIKNDKID
jgi:hypothetical protein